MIVIVTGKRDGHIEAVSRHLDAEGVPWVRVNIEDFALNANVVVSPANGSGYIRLRDSTKQIDLADVSAVWFRKPDAVALSHFGLDPAALDYVEAEFTEIVQGLYGLMSAARWINNPLHSRGAHRKMLQLQVARDVGFTVPRTLVTNDPDAALAFADQLGGDLVLKSLGVMSAQHATEAGVTHYGIFARRITRVELSEFRDKIVHMPTLLQEYVPKRFEARVTCVGNSVFGCRIQNRATDITADDYRFDTSGLEHSPWDCPDLTDKLHAYMKAFGLNFGCFDFAVRPDGQPVFFECNPNGQWLWVEKQTGLPIGRAVAEWLSRTPADSSRSGQAHRAGPYAGQVGALSHRHAGQAKRQERFDLHDDCCLNS